MTVRKAQEIPTPLENTRRRFERWRQTRAAKSRIPDTLWDAAARMADRYGLARAASVLRLDYYRLKRRLSQNASYGLEAPGAATTTTFLELPASVPAATAECVVELDDGAGAKMRICFRGAEVPDLAALSRSFWRGES
jgi:hypothetical protein